MTHQLVQQAVAAARAGEQLAAAETLLSLAAQDDPAVSWAATLAALGPLWWTGRSALAADLAERAVLRHGRVPDLPASRTLPLAIVAAQLYDGMDAAERLQRMAAACRPGSAQERFTGGMLRGHQRSACDVLVGPLREPAELAPAARVLADVDPAALPAVERRTLWNAAAQASRADQLLRLFDASGGPAAVPAVPTVQWPAAEALFRAGRTEAAEHLLVLSQTGWSPSRPWEFLPWTPVLSTGLRPAVTAAVRQAFLTRPVTG